MPRKNAVCTLFDLLEKRGRRERLAAEPVSVCWSPCSCPSLLLRFLCHSFIKEEAELTWRLQIRLASSLSELVVESLGWIEESYIVKKRTSSSRRLVDSSQSSGEREICQRVTLGLLCSDSNKFTRGLFPKAHFLIPQVCFHLVNNGATTTLYMLRPFLPKCTLLKCLHVSCGARHCTEHTYTCLLVLVKYNHLHPLPFPLGPQLCLLLPKLL